MRDHRPLWFTPQLYASSCGVNKTHAAQMAADIRHHTALGTTSRKLDYPTVRADTCRLQNCNCLIHFIFLRRVRRIAKSDY